MGDARSYDFVRALRAVTATGGIPQIIPTSPTRFADQNRRFLRRGYFV
jgi:hypothetical protein